MRTLTPHGHPDAETMAQTPAHTNVAGVHERSHKARTCNPLLQLREWLERNALQLQPGRGTR